MEAAILAVVSLVGALVLALWRHVDGRFNRLEDKVVGHGERIARIEGVQSVVTVQVASPPPAADTSRALPAEV